LLRAVQPFSQTGTATKAALAGPDSATSLAQLSTSLQEIARKVQPSVVQIFTSSYAVERWRNGGPAAEELGGILITAADRYIVTNAHVVEGSRRLQAHTE